MLKKTRRHPHIILTQLINASRTLSPISAIVSGRWVFICVLSILWLRLGPLLGVNRAARPLAGVTIKGVLGVVAKISRSARGRQRKSVGEYRQTNRLWQRESSAPRHRHGAPALRDLKESPTNSRDAMLLPSLPQSGGGERARTNCGRSPQAGRTLYGCFPDHKASLHPKTDLDLFDAVF